MRKHVSTVAIAAMCIFVLAGGAAAASRYIITSTHQIKPSVLRKFQAKLAYQDKAGGSATMCPSGTDTTGQCEVGSSDARCPGGAIATGGGYDGGSSPPVNATTGYTEPDSDGQGWHVIMVNNASVVATFRATAVCLGVARGAFTARSGSAPSSVRTQITREVALMHH